MKIWRHTKLDAVMLVLSIMHFVAMWILVTCWEGFSPLGQIASFALLVFMMVYNIIVISHLFTHTPWFTSELLNSLASMLNSINIGQSVKTYHLKHVRNHHRYSNDQQGSDGKTKDLSSTFQEGKNGEHASLFQYAFVGALTSIISIGREEFLSVFRLWRVSDQECVLLELVSQSANKRANELRQVRLDRIVHFIAICLFLLISWKWTLVCYLPAFYLALALVNVQNYYEHYGAMPNNRVANSVSYYGRLYNLLTFNDGYHQEHHLSAGAHWSSMPSVRHSYCKQLDQVQRIISPVPAIVGFLHRKRTLLHNRYAKENKKLSENTTEEVIYE